MPDPNKRTEEELRNEAIKEGEAEFDKERQRADQAEANFRKVQADREQLAAQASQLRLQAEQQQREIAELRAKANAEKGVSERIPEIDVEDADISTLAKTNNEMKRVLAEQAKQIATLNQQVENQHRQQTAKEIAESNGALLNKVCSQIETDLKAVGFRNEALAKFKERIDSTVTPAEAALILRKCYEEVKEERAAADAKNKDKGKGRSNIDNNEGGSRPAFLPKKTKSGSLKEVAAQYEAALGQSG